MFPRIKTYLAVVTVAATFSSVAFGQVRRSVPMVKKDVSAPISRIISSLPPPTGPVRLRVRSEFRLPKRSGVRKANSPTLTFVQKAGVSTSNSLLAPGLGFEGIGYQSSKFPAYLPGGAPSDPTLAVGPSHIVQWVNTEYAVYDKAGAKLTANPVPGNTFWSGFGTVCETSNQGDPILQYDKQAGRWVMSQFAFNVDANSGNPAPPFLQCVAVSQTGDPLGAYNRYAYDFSSLGVFNDYGKLGIWTDGYYFSFNLFDSQSFFFAGIAACVHDRSSALAGNPAEFVCFVGFPSADPSAFGNSPVLPVDLDGTTLPPANTAAFFIGWNPFPAFTNNGVVDDSNNLRIWRLKPDFSNTNNSTFNNGQGGPAFSSIAMNVGFTPPTCFSSFTSDCIPQAGSSDFLDSLGDRLMYRATYRRIGTSERLMVNHSVDPDYNPDSLVDGPVSSAIRWYEIRNPAAAVPQVFQNSTYIPDTTERWMGSMAMDKRGNIAIGYSTSGASQNPGIRIAARLASEPRNVLQNELTVINGTGSQTGGLSRWGDYSTIQVDPADDCTFWYTNQYLKQNGAFNWTTRIGSFKLPNCN